MKNPKQLKFYFLLEKKNLFLVALTGIIYNIGMTVGPYFEGRLAQCLADIIANKKTWKDMLVLTMIYVLIISFVQINRAGKRFYVRRFANNTSKNMRLMMYNSLIHQEKSKLDQEQVGNMMTKAISDVDTCVEGMRKFTTEIFDTGIVLIAYALMLCFYDFRLAFFSCLFIPCAYFIAEKSKKVVTKYNENYKKSSAKLNQTSMDVVGNIIMYRSFGLEETRRQIYEKDLSTYEKDAVKANLWESALQPIYHVIAMFGAVIIFYYGSKNVLGIGWKMWDIGAFTTFFSCFTKLALKSSKAAKLFNAVQKASVSWKRIKPMFHEYVEEAQTDENETIQRICFKKVSIAYQGHQKLIEEFSFAANRGQIIGITGAVASGKTAIGKVFVTEADYQGQIFLNHRELKEFGEENRNKLITYLGHETQLMSTSIWENILLENKELNSSVQKEIEKALAMVYLDEEVKSMPQGIHTVVGDGGMCLSGGQQSRLALARAFFYNKEIMILDDPFSALDKTTEQLIFEQLQLLAKQKIIFLISHRLSVFPKLDQILFLYKGKVSVGTHDELIKSEEEYKKLFFLQGDKNNA